MSCVSELASYFDGRFETISRSRELVQDDPHEREALLLELNTEVPPTSADHTVRWFRVCTFVEINNGLLRFRLCMGT